MTLADEMRQLSEKSRRDFLYNEMEEVLREIESAALRGEKSIHRYEPRTLHRVNCQDLRDKGFIVEAVLGTKFISPYIVISW